MPTYDYKCLSCGYTFEYFQPMSSELLKECSQCKGAVKRLIGSGSGPIFKGTGFYQTDYKNNSKGSDKKEKAAPAKSSGEAKDSAKETKPETKTNKKSSEK